MVHINWPKHKVLAAPGVLAATPQRLQHRTTCKIQNGRQGLKWGLPINFGRSRQLLQNKFLDSSTSSIRKVDDREKKIGSGELYAVQDIYMEA